MAHSVKKGFTLIELLVVMAIIAILLAIMLPVLSAVRLQSRVVAVNAELYQIGLGLEAYMLDNRDKHPPTRKDCSLGWEDHQLPPELVAGDYLPAPNPGSGMTAGMEDRFHPVNTYKYWAVGQMYQNNRYMTDIRAGLYVPPGFPHREGPPEADLYYDDPARSPVTWVIYSQGPDYDDWQTLKVQNGPVPKRTWYDPGRKKGLIVRMRLQKGRHVGSFE